jgi:hypothetical protein
MVPINILPQNRNEKPDATANSVSVVGKANTHPVNMDRNNMATMTLILFLFIIHDFMVSKN